jgi:coniferyl-aldehyde dehydrogenase
MATIVERPAAAVESASMLVGGEWVASLDGRTIDVFNPANRERIATVPRGSAPDVDRAVRAAAKAFETWKLVAARERGKILLKIADAMEAEAEAIARTTARETGNALRTQARPEAKSAADLVRYFGGVASELKGETIPLGEGVLSYTRREPIGVVGAIIPWNAPVILGAMKIAMSLATGNTLVLKTAEDAPLAVLKVARICAAHLPPGVLNVLTGYGEECGAALAAHPLVRKLSFTGSTEVGRLVMHAAAEKIVPVSLELGGKSPAIVGRGMPVAEAARRVAYGKCLNAGQTCVAPDYALVPEERVEDFVRAACDSIATLYPALRDNPDYTAIVNARQRDRLQGYLDDAAAKGARIVEVNPAGETFAGSPKMAPRIVTGVTRDMRLMQDEIFGPILPVVAYRSLDEAIAFVNARPRPLALYFFDHDRDAIERVVAETISGGVTVNETILHLAQDDLPFGGVGASGMGEYHGRAGFETFSKGKAVFFQSRLDGLALFRPPYGRRIESLLRFLLR